MFYEETSNSSLINRKDSEPSHLSISSNIQQLGSDKDIVLTKVLSKAKFPVLLGHFPNKSEQYAVKLYPFIYDKKHPCFINEGFFANLSHKNIISTLNVQLEKEAVFKDRTHKVSYIVMELAPYGDFYELLHSHKNLFDDEKLVRTYFHQLIEGLEYLHSEGVAHLDLKPQNLLLGYNYTLKICDFDQSRIKNQSVVLSRGTECFRAPEVAQGLCQNPQAADIYSAGIILFVLKSKGVLPYLEKGRYKGLRMFDLMMKDPDLFWEKHCEIQQKLPFFFDQDFRYLFTAMTAQFPEDRLDVRQIKKTKWYNQPVYSQEQLLRLMKDHIKPKI